MSERPKKTNVRALPGAREPVTGVVDVLDDMLERAAAGEIRGVVIAYIGDGDMTGHSLAWSQRALPGLLVAELDIAKFAIHEALGRLNRK